MSLPKTFFRARPGRFWKKVDRRGPNECWPWLGYCHKEGYGKASDGLTSTSAHRVAFLFAGGELQDGEYVCHRCDNPPCCNPAHLFAGSPSDNARDREAKGRRDVRGERNPAAKLTRDQATAIRHDSRSGPVIAAEYGITRGMVNTIRREEAWL